MSPTILEAWPITRKDHPGLVLQEILDDRQMSQTYLAWATGYTLKHINQVIKGHAAITATMAVRLERELERPGAEFWMAIQTGFDLHAAREAEGGKGR